jgi:hypothetical protein
VGGRELAAAGQVPGGKLERRWWGRGGEAADPPPPRRAVGKRQGEGGWEVCQPYPMGEGGERGDPGEEFGPMARQYLNGKYQ